MDKVPSSDVGVRAAQLNRYSPMPRSAEIGIACFAIWALAWCVVGIVGSGEFIQNKDFATAPEIVMPEGQKTFIMPACPPEVTEIHTAIWTELTK